MIGERLRKARKAAGMTLEEVAKATNSAHTTISRYENGKRKMDPETLIGLCLLYHVSADYILGLPKDSPYPSGEEKKP